MVRRKKEKGLVKERLKCSKFGCRKKAKYKDPNNVFAIYCIHHVPKGKVLLIQGEEHQSTLEGIFI